MTAFLIASIVYFVLSLGLGLLTLAINTNKDSAANLIGSLINILVSLGFITWSIILLVS